jgi:protease PrsW
LVFQLFEDVAYVLGSALSNFGAEQLGSSLPIVFVRIRSGVAGHMLFSPIFSTGLLHLLWYKSSVVTRWPRNRFILIAMTIHFDCDAQPSIIHGLLGNGRAADIALPVVILGLPIVALLLVAAVFRVPVHSQFAGLRDVLASEGARGCRSERRQTLRAGAAKHRGALAVQIVTGEGGKAQRACARGGLRPRSRARLAEVRRLRSEPWRLLYGRGIR